MPEPLRCSLNVTFHFWGQPLLDGLDGAVAAGFRTIELLDHPTSLRELRTLEATALPSGATRIEAPRGAGFSDDFADVHAILASELRPTVSVGHSAIGNPAEYKEDKRQRRARDHDWIDFETVDF